MTPPAARRVPRLRYRPTALQDLDECFELMPAWLGLDAALRDQLRGLWDSLIDQPAVLTGVMELPYQFDPTINLLSFLFSAGIGVVFGSFPARRAAQMDPIEALRHE